MDGFIDDACGGGDCDDTFPHPPESDADGSPDVCDICPTESFETDADGGWLRDRPCEPGEIEVDEERALDRAFDRVAEALRAADYFGPFGVDAFRWRDAHGARRFRAHSDVNARYTMGWWTGIRAGTV